MAEIRKDFISLVALGGQNPQILNVDFLKNNRIVSVDEPPFDKLFKQEKPFTKFVSTPVVSNLVLGNIEFVIDSGRFQIRDNVVSEWTETRIFNIAKKYFEVLSYTPLKTVGFNFNVTITFESPEQGESFQELFLPKESKIVAIISKKKIEADYVIRYPYSESGGRVMLTLSQSGKARDQRIVNCNYEFDFSDWEKCAAELKNVPELAKYFDCILDDLLKAI